jgi:hypothetical protein
MTAQPITAAGVRRALELPADATLPGRAALALDAYWRAEQHWQRVQPRSRVWRHLQARNAAWRARRFVPQLLGDPNLARVRWTGYADGSASAVLDSLWLRYARGQLWLAVQCPAGGDPHLARVHSLVELGELVTSATMQPLPPPWSCTALCSSAEPEPTGSAATAGRVVVVAGSRAPVEGGWLDTRFVTDDFERARVVLTGLLDGHVRVAFAADQFDEARELAAAADALPSRPPESGCWAVTTRAGAGYWLHTSTVAGDRGHTVQAGQLEAPETDAQAPARSDLFHLGACWKCQAPGCARIDSLADLGRVLREPDGQWHACDD